MFHLPAKIDIGRCIKRAQRELNSRANQASSSSLLLAAGRGAPSLSIVGSLTYPPFPNGFKLLIDDNRPVCCEVLTGISGSLLDQPNEFIDSLNDEEAILIRYLALVFEVGRGVFFAEWLWW